MSIPCWDSNPRPSELEFPHITTRPGLTPLLFFSFQLLKSFSVLANMAVLSTDDKRNLFQIKISHCHQE